MFGRRSAIVMAALVCGLATALVVPSAAPAANVKGGAVAKAAGKKKAKEAKFKLSLQGEQASTWRSDGDWEHSWGERYSCHREESERVSFATPRPLKVTVKTPKKEIWFAFGPGGLNGWGDPTFQVQADVERRVVKTGPEDCFRASESHAETLNCSPSARGLDWWLLIRGSRVKKAIVPLSDSRDQADPFPDCPADELADTRKLFPEMLLVDWGPWSWERNFAAKVSPRKLFNRKVKRITLRASDEEIDDSIDWGQDNPRVIGTERLSYTVSLKRIANK
jgi:hypothetical protein